MPEHVTNTLKVLVNFHTRKVTSLFVHRGSKQFINLRRQGFIEVMSIKQASPDLVFIESEFFDPTLKYPKDENSD